MNPADNSTRTNAKFHRQTAAFLLIVLSSLGLYFMVASNCTIGVWLLLGLIVVGMVLAAWKT
jgi:hypothetical protein